MKLRNYVILKAPDSTVLDVYMGPPETDLNTRDIAEALGRVIRNLVGQHSQQGCDVIVARGQNLDSVKKSLPELYWRTFQTHSLIDILESSGV